MSTPVPPSAAAVVPPPPISPTPLSPSPPTLSYMTPDLEHGGTPGIATDDSEETIRRSEEKGDEEKGSAVFQEVVALPGAGAGDDEYLDGGWRAWSVVAGAWCVSFVSWGLPGAYGVFQSYYATHLLADRSESDISWIGSFQLFLGLACAILAGNAFDAGYVKHLLIGGTVLFAASLIGLSYSTTYAEVFITQGLGSGLAAGIMFLPAVSCISHHFAKKRAFALGILATGSSIGGIVFPVLLNSLFNSDVGFRKGVQACAYLVIGLLVPACFLITPRLPPRSRGSILDFSVFKDREYSMFVGGAVLVMTGIYTPIFYLQSYATASGVDSNFAFYTLSILNAGSVFGRVIPNYLADRYGPFTILAPSVIMSAILIFVWIPAGKSEAGIIPFAIFYGIFSGCYMSMMPGCIASITLHMNETGIRLGMAFLMVSLGALAGTPISGAIITKQGGSTYSGAATCSAAFVLAGGGIILCTRAIVSRRKGNFWV